MTCDRTRMCGSLIRVLSAILLAAASITSAGAQSAGPLAEAARQVDVGEKVRVLRAGGTELRGELSAIEATFLTIDVDGQLVRLGAADVREIGVKDGVYNGILIGLGAGAAAGVVTGLLITSPDDGNLRGLGVSFAAAAGLGAGMGIGAAVDAARAHYRTIYGPAPLVRVSPFAGPGAYGAAVAVMW